MTQAHVRATGRSAAPPSTRSRWLTAAQVILAFVAVLYVAELVDTLLGNRLDRAGVEPREVEGLDGILWAPLLHGGWDHLASNTGPLLVLAALALYRPQPPPIPAAASAPPAVTGRAS